MSATRIENVRFGVGLVSLTFALGTLWLGLWAVAAPPLLGWSPVAVMSGSMAPRIETGDVVIVAPYDGEELNAGAVIVFDDPASDGRVTHRIVDVTPTGEYVTRGDANGRLDSTPVARDDVIGTGRLLVPGVAKPLVWADRGEWLLLVLLGLGAACTVWTSRWALLDRFDPWRNDHDVPQSAPGPRRPAGELIAVVVVLVVCLAVNVVTPSRSRALFIDGTGNTGNSMHADILQAPSGLMATGSGPVTLDWTATPDTYASGHRVYRATTSGGPYGLVATVTPRTMVTYVDSAPAGTYYYVARAFVGNWESGDSNEVSASLSTDDYDAIPAGSDNCPATFNIDQFDTDGDSVGDACDPSPTLASGGGFTDSGQSLATTLTEDVALGDVDGDGDLDKIDASKGTNQLWWNDGAGTFTDSGQDLGSVESRGVALGDLDGDGDLDVTFANKTANTVWFNNGAGTFTDSGQALGSVESRETALGDFDGDGDLDIVYANKVANSLWLNDGSGTFTDSGQTLSTADGVAVTVGDVDGDGDLDVVSANKAANDVWINDGTGTLTDSGQSLGTAQSPGAALVDLDGDGDRDLAFADSTASSVWWNDGLGTFTDSGQSLDPGVSNDIAVGDVDGDGDPDLVYASSTADSVWLNDGTGTFTDSGQSLDAAVGYAVAAGDLDGDGDLDLAVGNTTADTVWLNS